MIKKILFSLLSGLAVLITTWIYQNHNFTFSVEDGFISKLSYWKFKAFSSHPQQQADLVFINTGKDLALVSDSLESGNVVVTDREKLYQFLRFIDSIPVRPVYTVLDLQFYYRYDIDPRIDTLIQEELTKNDKTLLAILPDNDNDGSYLAPIYRAAYGYSEYSTYGSGLNKFRIFNQSTIQSIPVLIDESVNKTVYRDYGLLATCDGRLCMSAIWPSYYLNDKDLMANKYLPHAQYYTLGDVIVGIKASRADFARTFAGKIVIIGNFELDAHTTPLGTLPGSVIIADIFLSLLNRHHVVSEWFILISLVVYSALSYVAWFSKVPEVKLRLNFIFSPHLVNFIKSYISYFGSMFFLSLVALFLFNIQVALFLPSFIFSIIEYFRQKRYLPGQ